MGLVYIDPKAANEFILLSATRDRKYYLASRSSGKLALLVCQNGLDLDTLHGRIVDASIGWDNGTRGFCQDEHVGRRQTKISLRHEVSDDIGGQRTVSLSRLLRDAPPANK